MQVLNCVRMDLLNLWIIISYTLLFYFLIEKKDKFLKIFIVFNLFIALIIFIVSSIVAYQRVGNLKNNHKKCGLLMDFVFYYKNTLLYFHLFIVFISIFCIGLSIIIIFKMNEFKKNKFFAWLVVIFLISFSIHELIPQYLGCLHTGYSDHHRNNSNSIDADYKCNKEYINYIDCIRTDSRFMN